MYHSLTFTKGSTSRNTWTNWHLIPSSRPTVARPSPAYKYIEIPGMDGSIDISGYLTGKPYYSDCTGSFEFYVANDYAVWTELKRILSTFLDGSEMQMVMEDDPDYYYSGRFFMSEWKSEETNSVITIEYRVKPYKYRVSDGGKVWA